ncbi:DNA-binding protein [Mesorhizobium sp. M3A.F.Ca.ET.174.01.1.1]|nr:DNA-binding protein [Mesorhizobium sp. M3A.F.Ca.ET.201.01.1.1]TGS89673.1 DNA-binding protein [Mesorhizobium sp. M3A.F.Ca.ET.175.01.1.1]TGT31446.1 DNA-binding protein [Mesorhizobium sp. M3A.F.Ca.ET.174.01.1.1]
MRTPAAAAYISKSPSWLNKSRLDGTGPSFMRLGSTIVYDSADLDAWMASKRVAANDNAQIAARAA